MNSGTGIGEQIAQSFSDRINTVDPSGLLTILRQVVAEAFDGGIREGTSSIIQGDTKEALRKSLADIYKGFAPEITNNDGGAFADEAIRQLDKGLVEIAEKVGITLRNSIEEPLRKFEAEAVIQRAKDTIEGIRKLEQSAVVKESSQKYLKSDALMAIIDAAIADIDEAFSKIPSLERMMPGPGQKLASVKGNLIQAKDRISAQDGEPSLTPVESLKNVSEQFKVQKAALKQVGTDSSEGKQIVKAIQESRKKVLDLITLIESGDVTDKAFTTAKSSLKGYMTKLDNELGNIDTSGVEIGDNYGKAIASGLDGAIAAAGKAAMSIGIEIDEATRKALGIQSPSKKGIYVGKMYVAGVLQGVDSSLPSGTSLGQSIAEGLTKGLVDSTKDAAAAALKMAIAVEKAITDELDIASPSGVTEEYGKAVGEGQAKGIRGTINKVAQAAASVGEVVSEKIEEGLDDITGLSSSVQELLSGLSPEDMGFMEEAFQGETGRKILGLAMQTFARGKLPEKKELRGIAGDIYRTADKEFSKAPIKAIMDGFKRQEIVLKAIAKSKGREEVSLPEIIGEFAVGTQENRDLLKELLTNIGGLVGTTMLTPAGAAAPAAVTAFLESLGIGVGGITAGLINSVATPAVTTAGDMVGASITRKAVSDIEAYVLALQEIKEETGGSIKGMQLYAAALARAKENMRKGNEKGDNYREDRINDIVGSGIGNVAAEVSTNLQDAFSPLPFTIPLMGAATAITSVPQIAEARHKIEEGEDKEVAVKDAAKGFLKTWVNLFRLPQTAVKAEKKAINDANQKIKETRDNAIKSIGVDVGMDLTELSDVDIMGAMNKTLTNLAQGENAFKEIGDNFVISLARSIDKNGEATESSIKLAVELIKAFKKKTGIASPSKVFTEFGQSIVEGLEIGLADSEAVVFLATLAEEMIQAFKDAFGIASPSKVMITIGKSIVDGLLAGVSGIDAVLSYITNTLQGALKGAFGLGDIAQSAQSTFEYVVKEPLLETSKSMNYWSDTIKSPNYEKVKSEIRVIKAIIKANEEGYNYGGNIEVDEQTGVRKITGERQKGRNILKDFKAVLGPPDASLEELGFVSDCYVP